MDSNSVVLKPFQAAMRRWWAWQHPVVPEGYEATHWITGLALDNKSYPGHLRVIFGSLYEPLTDEKCSVPLVPYPRVEQQGIVNLRYTFKETGKYTYLPDAEKLFSRYSTLSPVCAWRTRAYDHPEVVELEKSLRVDGYYRAADKLEEIRVSRGIILVAQLNRTWIYAYGLGLTTDMAHLYEASCYAPSIVK